MRQQHRTMSTEARAIRDREAQDITRRLIQPRPTQKQIKGQGSRDCGPRGHDCVTNSTASDALNDV